MSRCMSHVVRALTLADQLLELADASTGTCDHDGCLILAGVLRDSVFKIRIEAERSKKELLENGQNHGSFGASHVV